MEVNVHRDYIVSTVTLVHHHHTESLYKLVILQNSVVYTSTSQFTQVATSHALLSGVIDKHVYIYYR